MKNWKYSNLMFIRQRWHTKISAQYVKACRRKVRKTVTDGRRPGRTDGRTDRHHHTIIRPVLRRSYKSWNLSSSVIFLFRVWEISVLIIGHPVEVEQPILILATCASYSKMHVGIGTSVIHAAGILFLKFFG